MIVFLNPQCSYGAGLSRWKRIEEELHRRIGVFKTEIIQSPDRMVEQVAGFLKIGENKLVAGGGDGTVNLLLNAIMTTAEDGRDVTMGAIGLGSSNDFHKPFRSDAIMDGIPLRVNFQDARSCDVIRIHYQNGDGQTVARYSLINSSIGITAEANAHFSSKPTYLGVLRKLSVNTAITAAALKTIFTFRGIPCLLTSGENKAEKTIVTNLGIIKNPHFAGSLCYDSAVRPDDGEIGFNLCENMSTFETILILAALSRHHFSGRPKTRSWKDTKLTVESEQEFSLESDGEVFQTKRAEFSVVPKAVRCCS